MGIRMHTLSRKLMRPRTHRWFLVMGSLQLRKPRIACRRLLKEFTKTRRTSRADGCTLKMRRPPTSMTAIVISTRSWNGPLDRIRKSCARTWSVELRCKEALHVSDLGFQRVIGLQICEVRTRRDRREA